MIAEIIPVLKLAWLEYVPISSIRDMPCQPHSKVLQHNANGVCWTTNHSATKEVVMNRQKYYPIIAVLAAALLLVNLTQCADDVLRHHVDDGPGLSVVSTQENLGPGGGGITLYAGQHMEVGTMQVTNDQDHLYVSYHTTGGWCITKTHLHVGLTLNDFPLVGRWRTPAPGRFDYSAKHECASEYEYVIDLGEWEAGQGLIIAAHAEVQSGNAKETAWAGQTRFAKQGNWATYFLYTVEEPGVTCGDNVTFTYRGQEVTYGTVLSNGLCWLDRNLGAGQVATSSTDELAYGDLFQWGRLDDGHQDRQSNTTWDRSNSDQPGHAYFILTPYHPIDWRSPQNDNLWQGVNGINNPCPAGFRLPTEAEWEQERQSWVSNDADGAIASPLKLSLAGKRSYSSGSLFGVGDLGYYWSSTVYDIWAVHLEFDSFHATMANDLYRTFGFSVRCIMD